MSRKITMRQLEVFESVARNLSFTRASEEIFMSQPAVSLQVKNLEAAVDLPLTEFVGRRMCLTDAGRRVVETANAVAGELDRLEEDLGAFRAGESGALHITVASTVNYFAARLFADFCQSNPEVQISLDVTNRGAVIAQLDENSTDIALMGTPPADLDVHSEVFLENPLVIVCHPAHPLVAKHSGDRAEEALWADLKDETFVIREEGSGTRIAMERTFSDAGFEPSRTVTMRGSEAIKQTVEAGLGLAMLSAHSAEMEIASGRLRVLSVTSLPILRHWYIVYRREKRLSAAAHSFISHVRNAAQTASSVI